MTSRIIAEPCRDQRAIGMSRRHWQKSVMESKFNDFAELIKQRQAEQAIECIKEYCLMHKNCRECGLFNGVCRVNQFPFNWDAKIERSNYE